MNLHGHAKIELTDVHTGNVEKIEKDNLITRYINDFCNPPTPFVDYATMLGNFYSYDGPLLRAFGGLCLFDQALGGGASMTMPPASASLIGNASHAFTNTTINPYFGSYNTSESDMDFTHGKATFVYDFATNQANGTIGSICLCPKSSAYGYFGYADPNSAYCNTINATESIFSYISPISSYNYQLDNHYYNHNISNTDRFCIAYDCTTKELIYMQVQANVITFSRYTWDYNVSLFRTTTKNWDSWKKSSTANVTVDLTANIIYSRYSMCVDGEKKCIYIMSAQTNIEPGGTVRVHKINFETGKTTVTNVANTTGVTVLNASNSALRYMYVPIGGIVWRDYIFVSAADVSQTPDGTNYYYKTYRIKISNPADVTEVDVSQAGYPSSDVHFGHIAGGYAFDSAFYSNRYMLNMEQAKVLRTSAYRASGNNPPHYATLPIIGNSAYCIRYSERDYPNFSPISLGLSTINDLASPVQKTSDKTMKITYTLQEATE